MGIRAPTFHSLKNYPHCRHSCETYCLLPHLSWRSKISSLCIHEKAKAQKNLVTCPRLHIYHVTQTDISPANGTWHSYDKISSNNFRYCPSFIPIAVRGKYNIGEKGFILVPNSRWQCIMAVKSQYPGHKTASHGISTVKSTRKWWINGHSSATFFHFYTVQDQMQNLVLSTESEQKPGVPICVLQLTGKNDIHLKSMLMISTEPSLENQQSYI